MTEHVFMMANQFEFDVGFWDAKSFATSWAPKREYFGPKSNSTASMVPFCMTENSWYSLVPGTCLSFTRWSDCCKSQKDTE